MWRGCAQELGQVDGICSFWEAAQALVASLAERLGLLAHTPAAVEAAREKQVGGCVLASVSSQQKDLRHHPCCSCDVRIVARLREACAALPACQPVLTHIRARPVGMFQQRQCFAAGQSFAPHSPAPALPASHMHDLVLRHLFLLMYTGTLPARRTRARAWPRPGCRLRPTT